MHNVLFIVSSEEISHLTDYSQVKLPGGICLFYNNTFAQQETSNKNQYLKDLDDSFM